MAILLNLVNVFLLTVNTTKQLIGIGVRRKLSFFGHTIRDGGCELVKCAIHGKVYGKRRLGRHRIFSHDVELNNTGILHLHTALT